MHHLKFIPEVEGLRGIAVLSVLIFHLNQQILPGGFTGVDIFFVISGFLITSIILKEYQEKKSLNMANFYSKRIKRILPLFCVVVFTTIAVGSILMLPSDLLLLARSSIAALTFSSNFHFSKNLDYFADNSNEYPLLHTWSLSIEEQFYFIWPLVLPFVLRKFGLRKAILGLCGFILVSLIFSDFMSAFGESTKSVYFHSLPRFGEIALGAALALFIAKYKPRPSIQFKKTASSTALILLAISFTFISKQSPFPGLLCLIPCGAAVLLILTSGKETSFTSRFLCARPLRFIGDLSYSLYMWHWPVFVFIRYWTGKYEISPSLSVVAIVVIFAASYLSRRFIEEVFLRLSWSFQKIFVCFLLIPFFVLLLLSNMITSSKGLPSRIADLAKLKKDTQFIDEKYCHNTRHENCIFGNLNSSRSIYLIGDSNAGHFTPFFDQAAGSAYKIMAKDSDTCPPLLSISKSTAHFVKRFSNESCERLLAHFKNDVTNQNTVILAANWEFYFKSTPEFENDLKKTLQRLEGKKVILMARIPSFEPGDFNRYVRHTHSPFSKFTKYNSEYSRNELQNSMVGEEKINQRLRQIASEFSHVHLLDPKDIGKKFWRTAPFTDQGVLTYKDGGHFNQFGSQHFGEIASQEILSYLSTLE
jgi:peptidoglycan/LPS O-acetylase OafA/YrhL